MAEFDVVAYQARVEARIRAFDNEKERPSTDASGKQLTPQTFREWFVPGIWVDTENNSHMDVPMLLAMFELPDTPQDRKRVTEMALKMVTIATDEAGRVVVL